MEYTPPRSVELTDEEANLNEQIPSLPDRSVQWRPIADAMEALYNSLIERDAIYLANVMRRMRQRATDGRDAPLSELLRFQNPFQ